MGNKIAEITDRPNLGYTFTVVDSDEINAFAVLGGYVYVTTGLLKAATSGAEVAGVIAHELGHINARHGVTALETSTLLSGIGLLMGDSKYKDIVATALNATTGLVFSQPQEHEADELGVKYALAAGYNAWGLVDFFEFLQGSEPSSGGLEFITKIGERFSTHPPTKDRIQKVTSQLEEKGVDRNSQSYDWDSAPFQKIQKALF